MLRSRNAKSEDNGLGRIGMATVAVADVRKAYGAVPVIRGVSIDIRDGEFVILVDRKSTRLNSSH